MKKTPNKYVNLIHVFILMNICLCLISCSSEHAAESEKEDISENNAMVATVTAEPVETPNPNAELLGKEYDRTTEYFDLSGIDIIDTDTLCNELEQFESLGEINFLDADGVCKLTLDQLSDIKCRFPNVNLNCSFSLFDLDVTSADTEISFSGTQIGDAGVDTLKKAIPLLSGCTKMLFDDCGISDEYMDELRSSYPDKGIVWSIEINGHKHYTDIERIRTTEILNDTADKLKYFTNVKYIDMGHRKKLTNWEFLSYMPKLQVLIVSLTDFSDEDLQYLTSCPELEFLEMFSCNVTDLTPLAECTSLEHLNIGNLPGVTDISPLYNLENLKRLRICQDNVPQEQKDEITQLLPDCEMLFAVGHPGFAGQWRYYVLNDYSKQNMVDRYKLLYEQFEYNEWPWYDWDW